MSSFTDEGYYTGWFRKKQELFSCKDSGIYIKAETASLSLMPANINMDAEKGDFK